MATPTFTCDAHGYLIQTVNSGSSMLFSVDLGTGAVTTVTTSVGGYSQVNAIGFNVLDNYIYGYAPDGSHVIQIATTGTTTIITTIAASSIYVGDIDTSGIYWFINDDTWFKMDLIPGSPTYGEIIASGPQTVPSGYTVLDWVYLPGQGDYLYTAATPDSGYAALLRFSMTTHKWEIITIYSLPELLNVGNIGAMYGANNGTFWASINGNGKIVQFPLTGAPHVTSQGPTSYYNDGARCALAL